MFILQQFTSPEVVGEYNVVSPKKTGLPKKDFIQFEKNPFDLRVDVLYTQYSKIKIWVDAKC